jgi:hypothetical protein
MALVPVRAYPAASAGERGVFPRAETRGTPGSATAAPGSAVMITASPGCYLSLSSMAQRPAGRPARCIREPPRRGVYADL